MATSTELERRTGAEDTESETAANTAGGSALPGRLAWLTPARAATFLNLAIAYAVLLWHYRPSMLLRRTLATGGDMGSHHYISKAFDEFFPFALGGWATGWFAGMPMLEFYFPIPYLLIWIGEHIVGYEIAFKLVTVLGVFALPVAAYAAFRLMDARRIVAAVAPAGAIVFLFIEGRQAVSLLGIDTPDTNFLDIFGGFITSTLAGEFAYSIGLVLSLLALGLLYRTTRRCASPDPMPWGLVAASGAVICVAALTHLLPMLLLVIAAPAIVIGREWPRRLAAVAASAALGAGLAAFFLVPMILLRGFTAPSIWTNESGLHWVVPIWFWPVIGVAVVGTGVAIGLRRPGPLVLAWTAIGGVVAFLLTPHVGLFDPIVNGRFLPIWYLMVSLLAVWGLGELADMIPWPARSDAAPWLRAGAAVVLAIALGGVLVMQSSKVRLWTQHNYNGYEAQPGWDELQALMAEIDALPAQPGQGRVMWEYNEDFSRFGTPRALENVPFFTDKDTMEGLLIESAASAQPHFYLQGTASPQATGAVPGYPYPAFSPEDAVALMQIFGVRYYVAESDEIIDGIRAVDGADEVGRSGPFVIFEIEGSPMVRVPEFDPVVVQDPNTDWRELSWDWMNSPDLRRVPVTVGGVETDVDETPLGSFEPAASIDEFDVTLAVPNSDAGAVQDVRVSRDEISFRTDRVGEPHLVAVSYFPNWVAEGAQGPYLVTPSLMLVVPTEQEVRLTYAPSDAERAGQLISLLALIALGLLVFVSVRRYRRRRILARGDGAGTS